VAPLMRRGQAGVSLCVKGVPVRRWILSLQGCVVAVVLAAAGCGGGDDAARHGPGYAITDVAVVDVEAGTVRPDQTVIVAGDRIERVGPESDVSVPSHARRIDGRGLYLMPGLVDAHVHYYDPPVFGRLLIANGVVLVRDMGLPTDTILKVRDALNQGETLGPEMVATGSVLDASPPLIPSVSVGLRTPAEGRAAVIEHARAGVDMIKVYSSLDREVFLAIVEEADRQGLKVVGHVPDSVPIDAAAAAGLRSSEHFFGFEKLVAALLGEPTAQEYTGMGADALNLRRWRELDPRELQSAFRQLGASGLTVCPTVVTFKAGMHTRAFQTGSFEGSEYVSQRLLDVWKSQWAGQNDLPGYVWQSWAALVSELNRAGVPLLVGTDLIVPGVLSGFSVHEEMAIWQEAGIPPADVLRSATLVPARFMGLGDRLGSVSEGKTASLALVRANPLADVRNAEQIEGVFLRGRYFDRDDLGRLLSEAHALAHPAA
jgi:imidazolonepropionase-like amidohydrolase